MRHLLLALCCVVLFSCGRNKASELTNQLPPKRTASQLMSAIDKAMFLPQLAELKGEIQVNSKEVGNIKLSTIIRLQADSAFWFSARKFGFEGARGIITKDSIIVLNRLQRQVLQASANDLPEEAKLLPIEPSLANLIAAFSGRPIGNWEKAQVDRLPGKYVLTDEQYKNTWLEISPVPVATPTRWSYTDGTNFGEVTFSDFRTVEDGKVFPFFRTLTFSELPGDTTRIKIALTSLTAHETLSFPISVPSNYSPM